MTEKKTPIPDMPGFSRDESGNLQFDPFSSKEKPSSFPPSSFPSLENAKVWTIRYSKRPVVFGFSPSSKQIKTFLEENPRTEFRFCTTARTKTHSLNITYHAIPETHEITIMETEVFSINEEFLGDFTKIPRELQKELFSPLEDAIIAHIFPLVAWHE